MIQEILQTLTNRTPLAPLCPTQIWKPEISAQISNTSEEELFGSETTCAEAGEMRLAVRAGLLLLNDDLSTSHDLAQQIETSTGSFWHAIMHRREGDFSNANYWFLRTGNHPAFADIDNKSASTPRDNNDASAQEFAIQIETEKSWKPMEFVALCENAVAEKRESNWLRGWQLAETTALLEWCLKRAN